MDFAGSFLGGLAVETLLATVQVVRSRAPWGVDRERGAALRRRFRPTADDLALSLAARLQEHGVPAGQQASIAKLLRRPEAALLLRQLMLVVLVDAESEHRAELQGQLAALLGLLSELERPSCDSVAAIVYDVLRTTCERLIEQARGTADSLAVSRDEAWKQLVLDNLRTISQATRLYRDHTLADLQSFEEFERSYRTAVHARHRSITPPHHDTVRRVPISKLFVQPRLRWATDLLQAPTGTKSSALTRARGQDPEADTLDLKELRARLHRVVVLGDPGGGKSTLALKMTYDLSSPGQTGRPCPIHLTLKDYAQREAETGVSIAEFIESRAKSHYQVAPPPGAIEYLLLSGRAMVVFDGLDELLDTSRRQEVVANVESFSARYPNAAILVTSRRVGYQQAPLDPHVFATVELDEFNDGAVAEYTRKWFTLDATRSPEERESLARSFLAESKQITDIRRNPLLLALLCNIYRAENYIPSSRAEVYRSCATLLFEKWDSRRGIRVDLPYRRHLDPTIKYLAHWIYADERLQPGITEAQLSNKITSYLCPSRIEDEEEAREVAAAFVAFCKGRAWVFTDTGTTSTGAVLYQFTHRTFLEYFAAGYLVRVSPTAADLWRRLASHIARQEWDVVAQLALQMKDEQEERAAATFLSLLLEESARRKAEDRWSLLEFAARALHVVVPGESTVRAVVQQCLELCIADTSRDEVQWWDYLIQATRALSALREIGNENLSMVVRSTHDYLVDALSSGAVLTAAKAVPIALTLPGSTSTEEDSAEDSAQDLAWAKMKASILATVGHERLVSLAGSSLEAAVVLHDEGHISPRQLLELRLLDGLVMLRPTPGLGAGWELPIAYTVLFQLHYGRMPWQDDHDHRNLLQEIVVTARTTPPPYVRAQLVIGGFYNFALDEDPAVGPAIENPDLLLVGFILAAIGYEFLDAAGEFYSIPQGPLADFNEVFEVRRKRGGAW